MPGHLSLHFKFLISDSELAHAATIVKLGRTFLRRMLHVAHSVSDLNHHVKLKADFKSDLALWEFLGNVKWA